MSPQVSRTLPSILDDFNNVVVISESSSPGTNPLVTVPRAPITTDIIFTFMFHNYFTSLAKSSYLFLFSLFSILFYGPMGQQSPQFCKFSFFVILIRSNRLAEIWWYVYISICQRSLCVSFFWTDSGLSLYHLLCFNAGKSSSFLFSWHACLGRKALCMVICFPVLWSIFLVLLWHTKEWSRVSYEWDSPGIYHFCKVPAICFGFKQLFGSSEIQFLFFSFI